MSWCFTARFLPLRSLCFLGEGLERELKDGLGPHLDGNHGQGGSFQTWKRLTLPHLKLPMVCELSRAGWLW